MAVSRKILGPHFNDALPWLTTGIHFVSEGYNSESSFLKDVRKVVAGLQRIEPFNLTRINKYWMTVFAHYVPVGTQGIADSGIHLGTSAPSPGSTAFDSWFDTGTDQYQLDDATVMNVLGTLDIREADGTALNIMDTFFNNTPMGTSDVRMMWNSLFVVLSPEVVTGLPANKKTWVESEKRPSDAFSPYYVGTSMNGYYGQVVARALCGIHGLGDEYEATGNTLNTSDAELLQKFSPNLFYASSTPSGAPGSTFKWSNRLTATEQASSLVVNAHPNPSVANGLLESKPINASSFALWEGGAAFTQSIYRTTKDGLLRRQIGNSALPVKSIPLELGQISNVHMRKQIVGITAESSAALGDLCGQELHYDWGYWTPGIIYDKNSILSLSNESRGPIYINGLSPDNTANPDWDYDFKITSAEGFVVENAVITWYDGTTTYHSNVLEKLEFKNMEIEWSDSSTTSIDIGADLAAGPSSPLITASYREAANDQNYLFHSGHKLVVNRLFTSDGTLNGTKQWEYTIEISLVFRGLKNDFEPGGALNAMKMYPEIGFTWKKYPGWSKTVKNFHAEVKLTENPMSSMSTKSFSNFFTDSNYPLLGSRRGIKPVSGVLPWVADFFYGVELYYPSWSYIFSYVDTEITSTTEHIMVYGSGSTNQTNFKNRRSSAVLPGYPNSSHSFYVHKMPRQGAYDNIHTHGDMMMHASPNTSKRIMMAPFCLESCVHMHWRWGLPAASIANLPPDPPYPVQFNGWSSTKSNALPGMPQIPPNQELKVKVEDKNANGVVDPNTSKVVHYKVDVHKPSPGCRQVICENGFSIAYGPSSEINNILDLFTLTGSMHNKMMQLYDKIRYYWDPNYADFSVQTTTQMVPEQNSTLENF